MTFVEALRRSIESGVPFAQRSDTSAPLVADVEANVIAYAEGDNASGDLTVSELLADDWELLL